MLATTVRSAELAQHPVGLLRAQLGRIPGPDRRAVRGYPSGRLARASGLVTHRQRPETGWRASVFVTLEDETGAVNVIVWPRVAGQCRATSSARRCSPSTAPAAKARAIAR